MRRIGIVLIVDKKIMQLGKEEHSFDLVNFLLIYILCRPKCSRCRKSKPANLNNYVVDPALQALQAGKEIEWQEVVDPATYQVYYYNKVTGVTQWDRPAEMGPAPVATGD